MLDMLDTVSVPTTELLHSYVLYLEKSDLVNGVQSILSIFDVSSQQSMCVRNVLYNNLPS